VRVYGDEEEGQEGVEARKGKEKDCDEEAGREEGAIKETRRECKARA